MKTLARDQTHGKNLKFLKLIFDCCPFVNRLASSLNVFRSGQGRAGFHRKDASSARIDPERSFCFFFFKTLLSARQIPKSGHTRSPRKFKNVLRGFAFAYDICSSVYQHTHVTNQLLRDLSSFCLCLTRRRSVKVTVVLLPLLGLTWVFGFMAVDKNTIFFHYIFAITNSLQVFSFRYP